MTHVVQCPNNFKFKLVIICMKRIREKKDKKQLKLLILSKAKESTKIFNAMLFRILKCEKWKIM